MFHTNRALQFKLYNEAREAFTKNPQYLIEIERFITSLILKTTDEFKEVMKRSYDEACYLYSFWKNYPPLDRGRSPRGDQIPWIEVGEHAIGANLARFLSQKVPTREIGLPCGTDQRFAVSNGEIKKICGLTDTVMLFLDVKSVGPRDDFDHTVLSPYQVSGDGTWVKENEGIKNSVIKAVGKIASHDFHCALPPIYILSDGKVAPTISVFLKPRYDMLYDNNQSTCIGQPLKRITCVALPNGLLLTVNPNYLRDHKGLFYPGKDDKSKLKTKMRARVSFKLLKELDAWRVVTVDVGEK